MTAAFTKAAVVIGIADVIKVQTMYVIFAGELEHGFDFEFLVFRMGRTEPTIPGRAVKFNLSSLESNHFVYKFLGSAPTHIIVNFPNVALQTILTAGSQA